MLFVKDESWVKETTREEESLAEASADRRGQDAETTSGLLRHDFLAKTDETVQHRKSHMFAPILILILILILAGGAGWYFRDSAFAATYINKYLDNQLESGLVGHWTFDGPQMNLASSTAEVRDSSGYNNNGNWINHATTTAVGKLGQAISFDGVDDYVDTNQSSQFNFSDTTFTVTGWFKTTQTTSGMLLAKHTYGGLGGWFIDVNNQTANKLDVVIKAVGGDNAAVISTNSSVNDGSWHHFVAVITTDTVTFSNNSIVIYLDGILNSGSISRVGQVYDINSNTLKFGRRETQNYFTGALDDIRIYNRALSQKEITRLYKLGEGTKINTTPTDKYTNGLVGYWSFDAGDMDNSYTYDSSATHATGTLVSLATSSRTIGRHGQALLFNGTSSYISTATNFSLGKTATVSFWLKHDTVVAYDTKILFELSTNFGTVDALYIGFNDNSGGAVPTMGGISVSMHSATGFSVYSTNNRYDDGKWHLVTIAFDRNQATAPLQQTIYVDGVAVPKTVVAAYNNVHSTSFGSYPIYIGARSGGSYVFDGSLDDVRLYNRILSQDEITGLYNLGTPVVINATATSTVSNGLIGYWTFDGKNMSGTSAYDVSSTHATGTLYSGATTAIGKIGQGTILDGTNDYIYLTSALGAPNTLSMSVWFKTTTNTTRALIGQGNAQPSTAPTSYVPVFTVKSNGTLRAEFWTGTVQEITSTKVVNDGNWHQAILTGNSSTQTLYLDGVLVGSRAGTISNTWWTTTTIGAGFGNIARSYAADSTWSYFLGSIDDVRIYNRVLTADEVQLLYNSGR